MLPRSSLADSIFASTPAWTSNVSAIEVLVGRACSPGQSEPNFALNLEVAEHINQKKANTPREAAMLIARLVNHRNPHIAMLALALLEILIQSCGYPFHLQIATKEFLNELVRRFPERPPPFPGPVISRILELIQSWKETICTDSRWKEDLGNIRDMHRLLTFKGYRFRDRPRQNGFSTSTLKSADELEEEDREAQSAKLQELIRRGTPRDLVAAQELMKALAGANPESKPDYRAQALTELNKLEQQVILLNEMLDNVDGQRGEKFVSGDVYYQVATMLTSARPRIQKWISDAESHDPESLDTFLQMNDQINTVLNRYESFKNGDYVAASNPIPSELATTSTRNELSLIDLDDTSSPSAPATADDLSTLFGPSSIAHTPAPSIFSTQQPLHSQSPFPSIVAPSAMLPGTPSQRVPFQSTGPEQVGSITLPQTPPQNLQAMGQLPSYFPTGSIQRPQSQPQQQTQLPTTLPRQQQSAPLQATATTNQQQGKDPFADLVGLF